MGVSFGENDVAPGVPVLDNNRVLKEEDKKFKKPDAFPKTPYELVAGQDPRRRQALREHRIDG
jgi:hypothetical protein